MLRLSAKKLEVRGVANATSKKGNVYYILRCENYEGEPFQFYARSADVFPKSLKKGDFIDVFFDYNPRFKDLNLVKVDLTTV